MFLVFSKKGSPITINEPAKCAYQKTKQKMSHDYKGNRYLKYLFTWMFLSLKFTPPSSHLPNLKISFSWPTYLPVFFVPRCIMNSYRVLNILSTYPRVWFPYWDGSCHQRHLCLVDKIQTLVRNLSIEFLLHWNVLWIIFSQGLNQVNYALINRPWVISERILKIFFLPVSLPRIETILLYSLFFFSNKSFLFFSTMKHCI